MTHGLSLQITIHIFQIIFEIITHEPILKKINLKIITMDCDFSNLQIFISIQAITTPKESHNKRRSK